MFAKVENGVTKSWQISRRKNRKNEILAWMFPCFLAGSLVVRESRDGRDISSATKTAKKNEKIFCVCLRFVSKVKWVRIPLKCHFWHEKTNYFGEGITSKLASQGPSWGIYMHISTHIYAPTAFWRKIRVILKKDGHKIYAFLGAASLYYRINIEIQIRDRYTWDIKYMYM